MPFSMLEKNVRQMSCFRTRDIKWGMQASKGRVTKEGKVSGKQMGFSLHRKKFLFSF
jgi:hypothetical protein